MNTAVGPEMDDSSVRLRPVVDSDTQFLENLYASTRQDISCLPLSAAEKQRLLSMQFHAQHEHYRRYFPEAQSDIILLQAEPAGRLYVDRNGDEIRLIDIALLPKYRRQGLGSAILQELLEEAATEAKPVRLRVEPYSPAVRLYERLGFTTITDEQANLHMECRPGSVCP